MASYKYLAVNLEIFHRLESNPNTHKNLKVYKGNIAMFVAQGEGAAVCPQYRAETVRQVRAGSVPGNGQWAAEQTQVLGQTHREGPRLLQEDARLGVGWPGYIAAEDSHTEERRTSQIFQLLDEDR